MKLSPFLAVGASLALVGCDAATDLAKDQLGEQIRTTVVEQCQSVSESLSIANELVTPICECTADTFMEKSADELTQVDQARVEEIVRACASEAGAATPETNTESTGG